MLAYQPGTAVAFTSGTSWPALEPDSAGGNAHMSGRPSAYRYQSGSALWSEPLLKSAGTWERRKREGLSPSGTPVFENWPCSDHEGVFWGGCWCVCARA